MERQRHVEVYDTPSNLGGSFTVSIEAGVDEDTVMAQIWYGRATIHGWEAWQDWHGVTFPVGRDLLKNPRIMSLYSNRT